MKKIILLLFLILIIIIDIFFVGCQKEKENAGENEVIFSITSSEQNSTLKNALCDRLNSAKKIILTIQTAEGGDTKYNNYEVRLFKLNNALYSEKISLKAGQYKLTLFALADSLNNILYAAPLQNTSEASLVNITLPVSFIVNNNLTTNVNVEVVSTLEKNPESFGLTGFNISAFMKINISVYSKLAGSPVSSKLSVISNSYNYVKMVRKSPESQIALIRDGFETYTLTVEKPGYKIFTKNFSKSELKQSNQEPIRIELECIENVTDNEGNVYPVVKIGTQTWMASNLTTMHFNNGDIIPTADYGSDTVESPKFQWALNDNSLPYIGRFYTWSAILDSRGISPEGWHIPSLTEWNTLINYLGGEAEAGRKLKEFGEGPFSWFLSDDTTDYFGNNESGFTALAAGRFRWFAPDGENMFSTVFWTSTPTDSENAKGIGLSANSRDAIVIENLINHDGLSVRCIKN